MKLLRHQLPFMFSETGVQIAETSLFHVVPVPLEKSVSYGGGTRRGPDAILKASQYLEIYDGKTIPVDKGIYTYKSISCRGNIESILRRISRHAMEIISSGKIAVFLGGEHTVTVGAVHGIKESGKRFGVVQFDAHADLRDVYEGSKYSHACVMKRIHDMDVPIFQIGVRSLSPEEVVFRKDSRIPYFDAVDIEKGTETERILPDDFPGEVYVTFDVDGLDPSVIRATGTPEPGGLTWWQAMDILEKIAKEAKIIGFDVVELAPQKGDHASDFAASRLVYNLMGYALFSTTG